MRDEIGECAMIRGICSALLAVAAVGLIGSASRAQQPVAPAPREIRPDGSRDPAPKPEPPAKREDPAAVVERIIKNSKEVGDKLAQTDTGAETLKRQDKILSDIDSLLNQEPPPPKDDQDKDKNDKNDKNDKSDMNKDPMMNKDMKSDMPPPKGDMAKDKKGMGMGMDPGMPMGGMNEMPPMPMGGNGRRPRMNDPMAGDKKDENNQQPDPMKSNDKKQNAPKDPKDQKNPGGNAGGGNSGKAPKAIVTIEEDPSKDVWGYLPDKLRQQMSQYYKEDVMPKYADLLRLYYSSFSEKGTMPALPKK
jgi:hypothetical protein